MADRLPGSGVLRADFDGSRPVLTVNVELDFEAKVAELDELARLDFDNDLRNVGVSNDSRAFGSSSLVYLPIEGLWITWRMPL
jgi:hypothetical protein